METLDKSVPRGASWDELGNGLCVSLLIALPYLRASYVKRSRHCNIFKNIKIIGEQLIEARKKAEESGPSQMAFSKYEVNEDRNH